MRASPFVLRAEAACRERAADAHARTACTLAGRAAFSRRLGDLARAAELEARLAREERREAQALARAASLHRLATQLEARLQTTRALITITMGLRPAR